MLPTSFWLYIMFFLKQCKQMTPVHVNLSLNGCFSSFLCISFPFRRRTLRRRGFLQNEKYLEGVLPEPALAAKLKMYMAKLIAEAKTMSVVSSPSSSSPRSYAPLGIQKIVPDSAASSVCISADVSPASVAQLGTPTWSMGFFGASPKRPAQLTSDDAS